jgi:hypothetical protein
MDLWPVGVVAAVAVALAGMAAVSAGYVGDPSFSSPAWYLVVGAVVGYWVVFARWARTD